MERSSALADRHLVRSYIQGNELALEQLISKHRQKVYGFLLNKLKDRDLANDLFRTPSSRSSRPEGWPLQ